MTQGKDLSVILNAIWATSSSAYQSTVPMSTAENITDVGTAVLNAPTAIRNEFMTNLYNKVGLTLIDSPVVENEFSFLKKGTLEYGQTIEDLYVGLASSEPYITGMKDGDGVPDPFSIRKLPHYSAFYSTILSRQYQVTRHLTDLKKAFHNRGGVQQFIAGMMNAMVSRENFDDMRATIALIARQIEEAQTATNFKGNVHLLTDFNTLYGYDGLEGRPVALTADTAFTNQNFIKYFANQLKKYSKRMRHLRTDLNIAGVEQTLPQGRQRLMMIEDITVDFETELTAWAYHKGNFDLGGVDEIDAWYSIGADHSATPVVTPNELEIKATFGEGSAPCVAVLYDQDMVKIYNKERVASDQANAKGNYWNMFMSLEDIYACSPYKNFVCFMLD
jgi:hypothetical protein